MRSQPKRFVVEVKRGTSRAAFASPDPVAEKFSSAEQALFGAPVRDDVESRSAADVPASQAKGRVLRSLIEPPAPVVEEPEPPRRGRKPGSKNRPKPPAFASPVRFAVGEMSADAGDLVEASSVLGASPPLVDDPDGEAPRAMTVEPATPTEREGRARARLRDRSGIIKRYVLGTARRPGEPGFARARRMARAAT